MILLARRGLLAIAAVLDIALHARPEPVAAKALALRLDLPPRYLEPLLQALVHSGILRGVRGPRGGYELARERRRISVTDILRASLAERGGPSESGPPLVAQVVAPLATQISSKMLGDLDGVTVEALCDMAMARIDAGRGDETADFTI